MVPLTLTQLKQISPRMARNPKTAAALFPHLIEAMEEAELTTTKRVAAFLGQMLHESGEFRYREEIWGPSEQQQKYERPAGAQPVTDPKTKRPLWQKLGNTEKGDGYRYRGRGIVQLTGRDNYRAFGKAVGVDVEANPDLAASPEFVYRVGAWFWKKNGLNRFADNGDFLGLTRAINGGYNGLEDREKYYRAALKVLG